ncbi:adenosylcobinamide-GDP ribazoletransferase [Kineosporia sp. NBRC 101731]|uniref:adenosylcobinamide-GDP ribazoletransferase n=1 Tax=Kineosporia sp. NBRC 101731 TaxID=3032199 RepID=UPI0024A2EEBA|nr:adenosylcobinamide-GDP ribazoletransferase [Kineosporia sp. NBRC 101731]GLY32812.1 adenosylcobinamide-GDP ribazoletransferase [Kineosporia sp. NBRC 101731]
MPTSRAETDSPGGVLVDALRLAFGTLTAFPVPPPTTVAPPVPGRAMAFAPLAGIVPGLAGWLVAFAAIRLGITSLVVAVLVVGVFALSTRALHLDGLADTADGFTASYDRDKALTVMRRGDSGPAGVVMVVIVLMLQVTALNQVLVTASLTVPDSWRGELAATFAVVTVAMTARVAIPVICRSGVPPARPEGLGAMVAGSVPNPLLVACLIVTALVAALSGWAAGLIWWTGPVAVVATVVAAQVLVRRSTRRLGGITGDIIGAGVEIGTAVAALALIVSTHAS